MSRYTEEVGQLTGWFRNRLEPLNAFQMTEEDYQRGVDKLPKNLNALTREAFQHWLTQRKYELSYSQTCSAFFGAALALGKLTLIPRHPTFRLGTKVLIREVTNHDTGEKVKNVPATIKSVRGDHHMVTGEVAIGNKRAGSWCIVVHTRDLEKWLVLR